MALQAGDLVDRRRDDDLEPELAPRVDRTASVVGVSLDEPFIKEDRSEPWQRPELVAEPVPQGCADDERD